jgi:hypothetical protein
MDQCALCRKLEQARDEAGRAWVTAKARCAEAARNPDAEEYIRIRTAEMTAQVEADLSRIELEQHERVHAGAN